MKKILLVFCFLIGFQMNAEAIVVDPYLAPVPNYYSGSAIDFAINVGTPYTPYCDPYYPYYCRYPYYSTGVYVSPYWNIGVGWGWGRPHYHHVPPHHPHHIHPAPHPVPRHYSGGHINVHSTGHAPIHHGPSLHSSGHHGTSAVGSHRGGHTGSSHSGHHSSGGHGRH